MGREMDLIPVNEDANFIIKLFVDEKWVVLHREYSFSTATTLMQNACEIMNVCGMVYSERTKLVVADWNNDLLDKLN